MKDLSAVDLLLNSFFRLMWLTINFNENKKGL
jgi:hypothetical protein